MATHTYTIGSEEGASRFGHELGQKVELDLPPEQERALVAAGWLEPVNTSKKESK